MLPPRPSNLQKRRRRFRRDAEFRSEKSRAGRIAVGPRDLRMIAAIAKNRFMSSTQLCRLFCCQCQRVERPGFPGKFAVVEHLPDCACTCGIGDKKGVHAEACKALFKSTDHVIARLRELYHSGYLDRPRAQLQLRMEDGIGHGSSPMVFNATAKGVALLGDAETILAGYGKLSWLTKTDGQRQLIDHTLAITDLSIAVDLALRERKDLRRLSQAELQSGMSAERRASVHPFSLHVRYNTVDLVAIPDLAFAIGDFATGKPACFLAELDRGHMPIERSNFRQTSIMRKLVTCAAAFEDELHRQHFGWKGLRILILTTTEARVASCVAAARRRFGSAAVARIFLFGTHDAVHDLFGYTFTNGRGDKLHLLD